MTAVAAKHKFTYRSRAKFWVHLVLVIGSILMIFPFIWTILTSFKTQGEAIMIPPIIFPSHWNFDSYKEVLRTLPFDALYLNTLILIFWRVVCASVFSSMAGYAFAKLDFPLKKPLFFIILTQLMLPGQVFIIPQYLMLSSMNQLNTRFALIFPGLVSAFGTFFLRQLHEPAQRSGRSGQAGRLQCDADLCMGDGSPDQNRRHGAGCVHRSFCLQRYDVAVNREHEH